MPSYKYWHVTRKVSIGGNVSLTDEAVVGGSREHEAVEEFENEEPTVDVCYVTRLATDDEVIAHFAKDFGKRVSR